MQKLFQLRSILLAGTVAVLAGIAADKTHADSPVSQDDSGSKVLDGRIGLSIAESARYIVRFQEQPLALYNTAIASGVNQRVNNIASIPVMKKHGRNRLDVASLEARLYVDYLINQQNQHILDIQAALGRTTVAERQFQHALNGVVMTLTAKEAKQVAAVKGVAAVTLDINYPMATDIGPGFIGATSVWWNTPAGQDTVFTSGFENAGGFRGDGIVIGDIDTGYNSRSPSFQATDASGYTIHNPLGAGNYIGQCNINNISFAGCNDKVIGVYDEINPSPFFSVEDLNGHGSHTASIAAGNGRLATTAGYSATISGVAPHANLVIYRACAGTSCSSSATAAAVDHAIQDGIVDILNFSIEGGFTPWNEPTSLAFLAAADAGIFVAAAGGNTTPSVPNQVAGTVNHREPWVTTVAASTHTGGPVDVRLNLTGPGVPPTGIFLLEAEGDTLPVAPITAPIVLSPTFHNTDTLGTDGCSAFAANQFQNSIALISRGTCAFTTKVTNAVAAGAIAVIISNHTAGSLSPSTPNAIVPVYGIAQSDGIALNAYLTMQPNTTSTASIPYPYPRQAQQADQLAGFSLLGPAGIDVIKPDVQAPGVNILAAIANDNTLQGAFVVGFKNGTSMAAPHTAGAAALLMGVHPDWTPLEVKSALMLTAKETGLTKANGTTPSDNFDRGSGRIQAFVASKAGLVLDESGLNFTTADPAFGGDPSTLNLASMQSSTCVNSCNFIRRLHSTQDHAVTWTASVTQDPALAVTVTPNSFPVAAHDTLPVTFQVNSSAVPANGNFHFAEVLLTPSDNQLPAVHFPIAIAVPAPAIAASPAPISVPLRGAGSANGALRVFNVGGPTLNFAVLTNGTSPYSWLEQPSADYYGQLSTRYTNLGVNDSDSYAADDFIITGNAPINLSSIVTPGFSVNTRLALFPVNLMLHWRIYSDVGAPASDPDSAGAAVWSYDATRVAPGVSVTNDIISLDLVTAGVTTNLPAGHYWLVVYPELPCCDEAWYWLQSWNGSGDLPMAIAPQSATNQWASLNPSTGRGLAIELQSTVSCSTPTWLGTLPLSGSLVGGGNTALTLTATAASMGANNVTGYLCLSSNDPNNPVLPVQVNASK